MTPLRPPLLALQESEPAAVPGTVERRHLAGFPSEMPAAEVAAVPRQTDLTRRQAKALQRLHSLAARQGGQCLALPPAKATGKVGFRCAHGHEWVAAVQTVQAGAWCPVCRKAQAEARHQAHMLQRARDVATRRGGLCLSDRYADGRDQAHWRCAHGHEWETAFRLVLHGSWCPTCMRAQGDANRRVAGGLQRLQALAASRGGQCLSESYLGNTVRYQMRCAEGHEWDALGSSLQRGSWCAICHQVSRRKGLETMHEVAASRGGQCLSSQYRGCAQKLTWLCHRGHIWQASWASIQRHWCPECAHMSRITNAASKARRRYGVDTRLALDPAVDPAPAQAVSPTTTAEA